MGKTKKSFPQSDSEKRKSGKRDYYEMRMDHKYKSWYNNQYDDYD